MAALQLVHSSNAYVLNFHTTRGDVLPRGGGGGGGEVYRAGANCSSLLVVTREIHSVSRAYDRESVYYFIVGMHAPSPRSRIDSNLTRAIIYRSNIEQSFNRSSVYSFPFRRSVKRISGSRLNRAKPSSIALMR